MPLVPAMFPTSAQKEYSSILVGRQPHRMIAALERIFDLSQQNSLVTYLTGDPGSGKSHTILHIQYRSRQNRMQAMIVIHANLFDPHQGNPLGQQEILREIHKDPDFREKARRVGVELTLTETRLDEGRLAEEINHAVAAIGEDGGSSTAQHGERSFGLVVAIDGLDEYVKPSGGAGLARAYTEQVMLSVRFLLDALVQTCIVLAFTTDIYAEVRRLMEPDRTFIRRFIPPQEFDGSQVDFTSFNIDETRELFTQYRNAWFSRARGWGLVVDKLEPNPQWPISGDAVELAHSATNARPGPLQGAFQTAFETLQREHPVDWLDADVRIDLFKMAEILALAGQRGDPGISLAEQAIRERTELLARWNSLASAAPPTLAARQFANLAAAWLAASEFAIVERSSITLPSGRLHVLGVTSAGKTGDIGLLVIPNRFLTPSDWEILKELASNTFQQVVIVTEKSDFEWVYSPSPYPYKYTGTGDVHLGNYSYVLRFRPEQLQGLNFAARQLGTPAGVAALWIADRVCAPIDGYRISAILSSVARNAIGNANL